jgi:23S rRNA (cytidine2498-2'-O)-methyltransferase
VLWVPASRERKAWAPNIAELVFARQRIDRLRAVDGLRGSDQVASLAEAAKALGLRFCAVWIEAPDSEAGKRLLATVRHLADPMQAALRDAGRIANGRRAPRLHVCFVERDRAFVGTSHPHDSSPWPMGIPRLRAVPGAPSRSGAKLVEALVTFIGDESLIARMRAGRVAVDLGAAPGGWSQVLASRGMRVIAVDNGPIAREVLATQLVEHRREDAFRFRPERPVDWMVCDVVAAPARIAALAAQWIARGWCRETIFNLKLPTRARWKEVVRCQDVIERALARASGDHELRMKHLYHDREEVTAHLRRL